MGCLPGGETVWQSGRWDGLHAQGSLVRFPIMIRFDASVSLEMVCESVKTATCPICHCIKVRPVFSTAEYVLVRCRQCSLIFKSIVMEESEARVNQELYGHAFIQQRSWARRRLTQLAARRLNTLARYLPAKSKILEIGCGTGEFVKQTMEKGYELETVELSETLCRFVSEMHKIRCFHGRLGDLNSQENNYHAIVAFDVFEHLSDPISFFEQAADRLTPPALIFLELPNWLCWESRLLGRYWNMANIRDHLIFPTPKSWQYIASRMSLKTIFFRTYELPWEALNAAAFALTNLNRIRECDPIGLSTQTPPTPNRTNNYIPARTNLRRFIAQELPPTLGQLFSPVTWPLRYAAGKMGWGTELSILAQIRA